MASSGASIRASIRAKAAAAACLLIAVVVLFGAAPAWAQFGADFGKRYALVVGNSDYAHVERLPNTARDAEAIADALEALRFTVFKGIDLTGEAFERLLEEFDTAAADADTVVFYFAGHGFQLNGLNYLAPVDAVLRDRSRIGAETLVLNDVIERIHRRERQTIVFLDACRNNPLPPGARNGAGEGLAQVVGIGDGTFIAFATQPGNVSYDGTGRNSPFTEALLTHIGKPARSISSLMIDVRNDVSNRTIDRQVPWDQSSLRADFYFNPTPDYVATSEPSAGGIVIGQPGGSAIRGRSSDPASDAASQNLASADPVPDPPRPQPATSITLGRATNQEPSASGPATAVAPQRLTPDREWFLDEDDVASEVAAVPEAPPVAPSVVPSVEPSVEPPAETPAESPDEERQMAALDPQQPLTPEPPEEPRERLIDPQELARSVQSDLARLGCYRLRIDGAWGPGSRGALEQFYREKGESAASLEPTTDVLARLQGETGTVCAPPKASPPKASPPKASPPKASPPRRRVETPAKPAPAAVSRTRSQPQRQQRPAAAAPQPSTPPNLPRILQ